MQGRFLFLGTGGSAGVPMIGCTCCVCHSHSTKDKRFRSAGLIKMEGKNFLIDVGPDFRMQALEHKINHLTAVLLTHPHSDHIAGIDDLRAFFFIHGNKIPCMLSKSTYDEIRERFPYFFTPLKPGKSVVAQVEFQPFGEDFGSRILAGVPFSYFSYFQNDMKVTGYRFGNFAYVSDIRQYSEELIEALVGVEILVLSAIGHVATPMHFSIEESIAFSRRVKAKHTYLTHVSHELGYEKTNAILPSDVRMSYDGLEIPIEIDE